MTKRSLEDLRTAVDTSQQVPALSIQGGDFHVIDFVEKIKHDVTEYDPQTKKKYVDVVFVDINNNASRAYYEAKFDPQNPASPKCFSDNGVGPSTRAAEPQAAACRDCALSQWGSGGEGKGKACRESKKIAVLVPSYSGEAVWLFKVPPTSLAPLSGLIRQIQKLKVLNRSALPIDVLTRISFSKDRLYGLDFDVSRTLPDGSTEDQAIHKRAIAMYEDGDTCDMIGLNDRPIHQNNLLPAPARPAALAAPKAPITVRAEPVPDKELEADRDFLAGGKPTPAELEQAADTILLKDDLAKLPRRRKG